MKFTAKVSSHVEQHPTGQMDTLNPETNQPVRKHETYVSISDGAQIVVASDVPINCQESIEVEGVVRIVETTPGSKGKNYRRPWIYVGSFRCL